MALVSKRNSHEERADGKLKSRLKLGLMCEGQFKVPERTIKTSPQQGFLTCFYLKGTVHHHVKTPYPSSCSFDF